MNTDTTNQLNALIGEFKNLVQQEFCKKQNRDHSLDDLYAKVFNMKKNFGDGKSTLTNSIYRRGSIRERVRSFSFLGENRKIHILLEFTIVQGEAGKRRHKIIAEYPGSEHSNIPVLS